MGANLFDDFLASKKEESLSPFLTPASRRLAQSLPLKLSIFSGCLLLLSFIYSFTFVTLSYVLLLFVYCILGTPAMLTVIKQLKHLVINIDVLMALSAFLSFLIGNEMEGGLLLVLFSLSNSIEETVTKKTKSALISLRKLSPTMATVVEADGSCIEKSVEEVEVGDLCLIRAGEIVPLDGIVVEGRSFVNLVHLTGENMPVSKKQGDEVQTGGRNLDGTLTIRVAHISQESTLSKIIQLIDRSQKMKPKIQGLFDRFGRYYAPCIIGLSLLIALFFPIFFSVPFLGVEGAIYRALAFLITASPCALIIAIPTAYLSAVSACAKKGLLLKGGIVLDAFSRCQVVAFDKTGTLTTGCLTCSRVERIVGSDCSESEAIAIAAALEKHVTHPIGRAVCQFAREKGVADAHIHHFQSVPGLGLQAKTAIGGLEHEAWIGSEAFVALHFPTFDFQSIKQSREEMEAFLLVDQTLFLFHFLDSLRPNISETVCTLQKSDIDVIMLTGDHQKSADSVAKLVNIHTYYAKLLPEEKLDIVASFSDTKGLAMVGDGINDAPALVRATVGISLGQIGSATAIDAADIVFLHDDLSLIGWLYRKAKSTMHIVKENLSISLVIIILSTTAALAGWTPLWLSVILHEGGTVLVGLNSLRLLKR